LTGRAVNANVLQIIKRVILNVSASWAEICDFGVLLAHVPASARHGLGRTSGAFVVDGAIVVLEIVLLIAVVASRAILHLD